VQIGFERAGPGRLPVVAAEFSVGDALVNYDAGHARSWGVPVPRAVVVLAGDRGDIVGKVGAQDFLTWLEGHPAARKTYRLIRSHAALTASHGAPKEPTPAATRAFWATIDGLVTAVRAGR